MGGSCSSIVALRIFLCAFFIVVESCHAKHKLSALLPNKQIIHQEESAGKEGREDGVKIIAKATSRSQDSCPASYNSTHSINFMSSAIPNYTITIGFLTPYNQNQFSLGAIRLAVDNINNSTLLGGKTLCFIAADIGSSNLNMTSLPIKIMTDMRDKGAIAFIGGPEDTCAIEALVTAAWNLPMISYKCSDYQVSNKGMYSTFARTLPPSSKVTKSVVSLLKTFHWDKIAVVMCHRTRDRWYQILEAFKILAKDNKINITSEYSINNYLTDKFPQMQEIVRKSYETTRVYVFIGEHLGLIDLVRALDSMKLLDTGDYVIISVDDQIWDTKNNINLFEPWTDQILNDTISSNGFKSVLKLTLSYPKEANYSKILHNFANLSTESPFYVPFHPAIFSDPSIELPIEGAYLYDAVMVYAEALSRTLSDKIDPRNGTAVFQRIRGRSYRSVQGFDVFIDSNGDAEGNYTVITYVDEKDSNGTTKRVIFPVGDFKQVSSEGSHGDDIPVFRYFNDSRPIQWVGGKPPLAEPPCGFKGERCAYEPDMKTVVGLVLLALLALIATILVARHYRYEQKLACLLWKIDMKDVVLIPLGPAESGNGTHATVALCRQLICSAVESDAPLEYFCKKAYTQIGFYKGTVVAIKPIYKRTIDLTRSIRKELIQIRELRHENIIPFIGASVETGNINILTAYCSRGSLQDVLRNQDLHLDNIFLASLVADLIRGMIYIHDSEIISHGNLKSSNCLVDSRWVLQISDFGLHEFKAGQEIKCDEKDECTKMLWKAPELIRAGGNAPLRGTQKGDVYSFGIVLYELIGRQGPWGKTMLPATEIVKRVANPELNGGKILRPSTDNLECGEAILKCLHICWDEEPEQRPDFRFIRVRLKEMQSGLKPNIFDNMLSIMEKYASNLEDLVQERTNQLTEEKKKTDALLHRMLPKSVAESLKRGEPVEAESFDSVTIYFSDIVGFTALSAVSTPMQVVELLNDLYTCFDSIISNYDVYKVETIGDAYMVVSGLPIRNGSRHAGEIASMALHLLERIKSFEIRHRPSERLKLRIGIHSGPVVAGVVGLKMPRYCLFGDTVNTASRMESTGEALRIHISYVTKELLTSLGEYKFQERGIIAIKGKGDMRTYWLIGEDKAEHMFHRDENHHQNQHDHHSCHHEPVHPLSNSSSRTFVHSTGGITKTLSVNSNRRNNEFLKYEISENKQNKIMDCGKPSKPPHTWLLEEGLIRPNFGNTTYKAGRHRSCSSILQDCKASIIKELKRNGSICTTTVSDTDRFRSAPIITFIETPVSGINVNASSHLHLDEPRFV